MIIHGDCLEEMKKLEDNSVDAVVTDPPYHLTTVKRFGKPGSAPAKYGKDGLYQRASKGFMGKEWDGGGIAFSVELWAEVLRVLKEEHRFLEAIILTGHGSLESAVELTKLGAFSYLPKPYELEKLIEVLKEAYQARLEKKFASDQAKMDQILAMAKGESPLGILRKLRDLDDARK